MLGITCPSLPGLRWSNSLCSVIVEGKQAGRTKSEMCAGFASLIKAISDSNVLRLNAGFTVILSNWNFQI